MEARGVPGAIRLRATGRSSPACISRSGAGIGASQCITFNPANRCRTVTWRALPGDSGTKSASNSELVRESGQTRDGKNRSVAEAICSAASAQQSGVSDTGRVRQNLLRTHQRDGRHPTGPPVGFGGSHEQCSPARVRWRRALMARPCRSAPPCRGVIIGDGGLAGWLRDGTYENWSFQITTGRRKTGHVNGMVRLICAVSTVHRESREVPYFWFALHDAQLEFVEAAQTPYICLGCFSSESTLLVPLSVLQGCLNLMSITKTEDGRQYWHIVVLKKTGKFIMQLLGGKDGPDLTEFNIGSSAQGAVLP